MRYSVEVKGTATMLVMVDADTPAEAKAAARRGEYDPVTEAAFDYSKPLSVVRIAEES